MRLFVAVEIAATLIEAVETDVVNRLRDALPTARWTHPEHRHLTLAFLGETPDERVDEVAAALHTVAASGSFEITLGPLGAFPNLRRPRVLWLRVGEGADRLAALAGEVAAALAPVGYEPEDRPFRAHLTLARFRDPPRSPQVPEVAVPGQASPVRDIVLFRSQLRRSGAVYTPLARRRLDA